jgi:hypothetical protein
MAAALSQGAAADQPRSLCPRTWLPVSGDRARRAQQGNPAKTANHGQDLRVGPAPSLSLKPGARLVREWGGRTHTVTVTEDGFEYAGQDYPLLTRIAKKITGAHWSGPRFFGLLKTGAQRPDIEGRDG